MELKNKIPANVVPNTEVERMLTINGKTWEGVWSGEVTLFVLVGKFVFAEDESSSYSETNTESRY